MAKGDGEADGAAERLGCGVRDGLDDRIGLVADGVGLDTGAAGLGVEAGSG